MTTAVLEKTGPDYDLKAVDRCEVRKCYAQAYIVAFLEDKRDETTLLFCNHHAKNAKNASGISHAQALVQQGFTVLDYSDRLEKQPYDPDTDND